MTIQTTPSGATAYVTLTMGPPIPASLKALARGLHETMVRVAAAMREPEGILEYVTEIRVSYEAGRVEVRACLPAGMSWDDAQQELHQRVAAASREGAHV